MRRFRLLFISVVASAALIAAAAQPAFAVGARVYRTDDNGNETSSIVNVGDTNPACCCVSDGEGEVHLGARVCYLPL